MGVLAQRLSSMMLTRSRTSSHAFLTSMINSLGISVRDPILIKYIFIVPAFPINVRNEAKLGNSMEKLTYMRIHEIAN